MGLAKIGAAITLDGEKEYRQALSNINSSMATLRSEMSLSRTNFEGQANSIQALTERGKILNRMYSEQETRCRTIAGALQDASERYGENSTQAQRWQAQLNNAQAELTRLGRSIDQNNEYLEEAGRSTNGCATSIDEYGHAVREAEQDTLSFGDVLKANLTSEAIIAGAKALKDMITDIGEGVVNLAKESAAYADDILTLSNNTGLATDTLQELKYMQELTDVSLEKVTSSMAKQIKSMSNASEGSKKYVEAYERLGVEIRDTNGELRNSEKVYWECIDALGKISNETERDTVAMQLFGKSAQDLNSIIKIGSEGVKEFAQEAHEVGAVLDDETLGKLGEADDAFQRMDLSLQIARRNLGLAFAPSVTDAIGKVSDKLIEMGEECADIAGPVIDGIANALCWIIDNAGLIISSIGGIISGFASFKAITGISQIIDKLKTLSITADGATGIVKGLWKAISSHPAAVAAVGIGVFVTALANIAIESKNSKSELEILADEIDETIRNANDMNKSIDEMLENQKKRGDDIESDTGKYKVMANKLFELANAETLSNEQKAEMKVLVNELNKAFPELGLSVDELTGKLNKHEEDVYGVIDSYLQMSKVQAARDDIDEITKRQYEAEKTLTESIDKHTEAQEQLNKKKEEYNVYAERFLASGGRNANELNKLGNELRNAEKKEKELSNTIEEQKSKIEDCNQAYRFAMDYIKEYDTTLQEAGDSSKEFSKETSEMSEEATKALEEIRAKYEEVKEKSEETLLSQIGLFDEYKESSKLTKEEILENLQSQIDGMANWNENMKKASELGVSENIIKEFRDMGLESSGYLSEILKMNEKEIAELNSKWETKLGLADQVSKEMALAQLELEKGIDNMNNYLSSQSVIKFLNDIRGNQIEQAKQTNAMTDNYKAQQQIKRENVNVYIGNEQVTAVVRREIDRRINRFNP